MRVIQDNDPRPKLDNCLMEYVNQLAKKPYHLLTDLEKFQIRTLLEIEHYAKEYQRHAVTFD